MESLSSQQVRDIIAPLRKAGYEVVVGDVCYALLSLIFGEDRAIGYRVVFGENPPLPLERYEAAEKAEKVREAVAEVSGWNTEHDTSGVISFDELKDGLVADMRALEKLRDSRDEETDAPLLDAKEMAQVVGRIADIRVKLTEKFGTVEKAVEQRVVVEQKYDAVCPYCHHEIAVPPGEQRS